jgi:hypothetical protein
MRDEIAVYCAGKALSDGYDSHATRVAEIALFKLREFGWEAELAAPEMRRGVKLAGGVDGYIDQAVETVKLGGLGGFGPSTVTLPPCRVCRYTFSRRWSGLPDVLTRLAVAGVSRVSLRGLDGYIQA